MLATNQCVCSSRDVYGIFKTQVFPHLSGNVSRVFDSVHPQASGCTLQSSEGPRTYSLCEELLPGSAAKLYWTLDASSSPVVLTGAMEASTAGWLGFGFPAVAGQMQGGNAVIAKPCSSCPSGESKPCSHCSPVCQALYQPPCACLKPFLNLPVHVKPCSICPAVRSKACLYCP